MENPGDILFRSWPEVSAVVLLIAGFLISISVSSSSSAYLVVFVSGIFAGRYFFSKLQGKTLFPFFLIIVGFIFGYVLGSFSANRIAVTGLFLSGWTISHKIHKQRIIRS